MLEVSGRTRCRLRLKRESSVYSGTAGRRSNIHAAPTVRAKSTLTKSAGVAPCLNRRVWSRSDGNIGLVLMWRR